MAEHVRAQVAQERLADAGDHDDDEPAEDEADDGDAEVQPGREVEGADVLVAQSAVDAEADEERAGEEAGRLQDQQAGGERDPAAVGAEDLEQPAHHPRRVVPAQLLVDDRRIPRAAHTGAAPHATVSDSGLGACSRAAADASTSR